jgi:alpha-glucoside transport system substrate-binding protein
LGLALAASVLLFACGGDDEEDATDGNGATGNISGASVDVLGVWGSDELPKFEAMARPWETETGAEMQFTGTRDTTALLTTRVEGGSPPDIAIPAEIGLFQDFAREGRLTPLSACAGLEDYVQANYPDSFLDLGTVDGTLYGFFMKADTKATVWYNPGVFDERGWVTPDAGDDFDDLVTLSNQIKDAGLAPWSIGVESGGASGWPGSDWIQQIIISEEGEDFYDDLAAGDIPYTDPRVKEAWEKFGTIALTQGYVTQGGAQAINATTFQNSSYAPFQDPPRAAMVALGGFAATFIEEQFPNARPGTDYDFFDFPSGKVTGGANIVYAFNSDPATCSLLSHLASADAQRIWVESGGFTSVNQDVDMDAYPNEVAGRVAEQLLDANVFRFDLDDLLGGATQQAIFTGVTEYLANPSQLDAILSNIESTRVGSGGGR